MPGKKMKKGAYEMNHPNMMKPYQMGHSPKQMNHPMNAKHPNMMKGPYTMRPSILNQMSHNK